MGFGQAKGQATVPFSTLPVPDLFLLTSPLQMGIVEEMRETGITLAGGLQAAGEALGVTGSDKRA